MKISNAGNNNSSVDNEKDFQIFYMIREAVIWVVLEAAFLIPFLHFYYEDVSDVPVIALVSNNYVLQQGEQPPELSLYAGAAVLMDAENRRVLYGKNEDAVMPMASTTKIMTCILALESGKLDEPAAVSSYAASQPKVHAGLRAGEQYYVRDLLYSMMLESHNDTAVVVAEHIGGSVEGFAEMMNEKAESLGMENTYFITPNGLDAADEYGAHSTTARDLAVLCAYALQNEEFCSIVTTPSYQFWDVEGRHSISAYNKDAFLQQMSGALGIKTGFTNAAGYCFAGALENQDRVFISVVLACGWPPHRNYKWQDTAELMNYGIENYESREIGVPAVQGTTAVTGCVQSETSWMFPADTMPMLTGDCDIVKIVTLYPSAIEGPAAQREQIGIRYLLVNGEVCAMQKLWQPETMEVRDFPYVVRSLLEKFML